MKTAAASLALALLGACAAPKTPEAVAPSLPPAAWHQITAGHDGARFLCCCAPPYSDADTFFTEIVSE